MNTLLQDVRYGLRMLGKSPGFTLVAVLTLALGIGANTAIFSVIHAVLLKSFPYPDPDRLVILREYEVHTGPESVSWMDYLDWRQQSRSFEEMAAYHMHDFNFTGGARPEVIRAGQVTSTFFPLTGAKTILGRPFNADEDKPGANPTAVLAYSFWRTRMGADPSALGKSVVLDGVVYTVVGVFSPDFSYLPKHIDLYIPAAIAAAPGSGWLFRANHPGLEVLARLRPDASLASARSEMDAIMQRLDKQYPDTNSGQGASVKPLYESRLGDVQPTLLTLVGGVLCVLLIACANVANLSLARAAVREREFAVRASIGAGRGRIIRQLLTESVLLSLLGGIFGLLLAMWSIGPLLGIAPAGIPRLSDTHIDIPVLLFSFAVAGLVGILFGLAPAFQMSRTDLNSTLRESGQGATPGRSRQRLRAALLVAEVAVAVVLVIASGLLARSLLKALAVDPGFRIDHVLAVDVNLPNYKYKTDPQQRVFLESVLARTRNLPGVVSASAVYCPPLGGDCWDSIFYTDDRPVPPVAELPRAVFNIAEPEYFRIMGVPLLKGRWFNASDTDKSAPVVLINETAARRWWPDQNPLGKNIKQDFPSGKNPFREIVGVVGDLKQNGPDQEQMEEVFEPSAQNPMPSFTLVVRSGTDPMSMASAVEAAIHEVDPDQPIYHVKAMTQYLGESLERRKFSALLLGLFGGLALLLATVGVFGVMAYSVTQRTREIGIRMALGAQQRNVLDMVVTQGARLAAAGVAIGLIAALFLTRTMSSLLFGVGALDPLTFAAVAALLVGVALAACYIPARRASRVDPLVALHYE